MTYVYRVTHLLANLGWVDLNFDCSTVCPILPGLVGIWQKRLGKMVEHPKSMSTEPRFAKRWVTLYFQLKI